MNGVCGCVRTQSTRLGILLNLLITGWRHINMDDIRKLKILSARLNRIDYQINLGGCCVVAAAVAKQLSKTMPVQIRVLNNYDKVARSIVKARPRIGNNEVYDWNSKGIHFGHVVLQFKVNGVTHFWDTETLAEKVAPMYRYWTMYPGSLTVQEAWELSNDEHGWNDSFNRDNIPTIRASVNHFFNHSIKQPFEKLAFNEMRLANRLICP